MTWQAASSKIPKVGLEPTRVLPHRILSPARLPFRHFGPFGASQFTRRAGGVNPGGGIGGGTGGRAVAGGLWGTIRPGRAHGGAAFEDGGLAVDVDVASPTEVRCGAS